jgi:sigma-B regulation protein RsbU (phosphoserine phosphatase)
MTLSMRFTSLTTRLVLLLTTCIAGTLLVTSGVEYGVSRQALLLQVEADTEQTVAEAVRDLQVRLVSLEESTELLAEIITQQDFTQAELVELLREAVDERNDLFGAAIALEPRWTAQPLTGFAPYFFYRDGSVEYADLAGSYDYPQRGWFREPASLGRPTWSEPYLDAGGSNTYMTTYSVPMYREIAGEQVFYGVVTADLTLAELEYYLQRMQLGESGFGFLLSRNGKIMAAQNRDHLLKPLLQILPAGQDSQLWGQLLRQVAGGERASAVVPCAQPGSRCIVKLAPLPGTQWPVGAFYSEHETLAPLREYLLKTALSTGITLVLLVLVVIWVSRRITRPLGALARATINIATGDFQSPLPEARSRDELGRLVHAFSLMQDNLQLYVGQLEAETASRNRLQGELDAATAIQMSMLPPSGEAFADNPEFSLWARIRPAKAVGGDLYAFHLEEAAQRLFIAVGDVSDKGVPAAIFMARAMTLLQQYARAGEPASEIMAKLNDALCEGNDNCMFVTLFTGWLCLDTLQLSFAAGGHTPPSLLRQGRCESIEVEDGPALGLMEALEFPLNQLQLQAGDLLAIYTDGIDEAFDANNQQFGTERFNRVLEQGGALELSTLGESSFSAIDTHAGAMAQSDDITLMLLQIPAAKAQGGELTLPADATAATKVLAWLARELTQLSEPIRHDLLLVSEEVVTNIVQHGQLAEGANLSVQWQYRDEEIELGFSDPGIPFDPITQAPRATLGESSEAASIGGLGVHLLEALTDRQHYQRINERNCLRLFKLV